MLMLALGVAAGCRSRNTGDGTATPGISEDRGTADPKIARTLQADIQATAQWVATLPLAPTATPAPLPTYEISDAVGTPAAQRTDACPVPEGFSVHDREGFCVSAPEAWASLNVDGGAAVSLNTIPSQAITLRPDWATSTAECQLTIYILVGDSAEEHLGIRHAEFSLLADLATLSPIAPRALGELLIPGFTWSAQSGAAGGVYADTIGANRLLHLSMGGEQCPAEELIPVIDTLRLDAAP